MHTAKLTLMVLLAVFDETADTIERLIVKKQKFWDSTNFYYTENIFFSFVNKFAIKPSFNYVKIVTF